MQEFDEVLNFDIGNKIIYNLLCEDVSNSFESENMIMPFIGDGLSEFAFGTKKEFINYLINIILDQADETVKQTFINKSNNDDFLVSLENIINELGGKYGEQLVINQLIKFYTDKKIDKFSLQNQAVSLVPFINNGDSITINFDHVLEYAYELAGINPAIATPYDYNRINRKIRGEKNSVNNTLLFKIHGDIISNATERIITRSAFEQQYKNNTDFTKNLSKWLAKYKFLFVGVDLLKDQYLQGLLTSNSSEGVDHYAIIGCRDSQIEKNEIKQKLSEINVLPIIYDVSKPNSIEIILHKLLVDTKNECLKNFLNRGVYHYRYSKHDLVGREKEIEILNDFITTTSVARHDFSWWMFWGVDVAGKSKLAYDFARNLSEEWVWYIIDPGEIDAFLKTQVEMYKNKGNRKNIFIIFDDFDFYRGNLSNILEFVNEISPFCNKIRILFVAQKYINTRVFELLNSKDSSNPNWNFLVQTAYDTPRELRQLSVKEVVQICFNYIMYQKKSLGLSQVTDQDLQHIAPQLEQYVSGLLEEGECLLLLCSLEKAISLIAEYMGDHPEKSNDKEIISTVIRYILTAGEGNFNNSNVDVLAIDETKDYRKTVANHLMKKYDNEKEYINNYQVESLEKANLILSKEGSDDE